jgi:hypothetical protein
MTLRRFVIACVALAAMGVMAPSVQAQTPPPPTLSPAFERAYLSEMDAATRAEVDRTQPVRARAFRPEDTADPEVTQWRALRHPRPSCPSATTRQPDARAATMPSAPSASA